MNYETAWKAIVEIANTIKDNNYEEEVEAFILCIEYLQSELETESLELSV